MKLSIQERMDVLDALAVDVRDAAMEWAKLSVVEREGSPLEGQELYLSWQEDGTVSVQCPRYVEILRAQVEITVSVVAEEPPRINEPDGPEFPSQWGKVPSGWFVKTPKGEWLEVTSTYRVPEDPSGHRQMVGLLIDGKVAAFKRDPKGEVWARRGTLAPADRDAAMEAFQSAFQTTILRDEPPGQS